MPRAKPLPATLAAVFAHECLDERSCREYLTALGMSEWSYHLDDDPGELGAPVFHDHADTFRVRVERCRELLGSDEMWNHYAAVEDVGDSSEAGDETIQHRVPCTFIAAAVIAMLDHEEADKASTITTPAQLAVEAERLTRQKLVAHLPHVWVAFQRLTGR